MPLPPGRMGLPIIGETIAFLNNMYLFLETRRQRHGPVFKSSVLGRKIVFVSGTEGAEAFYESANISRADAHPSPSSTSSAASTWRCTTVHDTPR